MKATCFQKGLPSEVWQIIAGCREVNAARRQRQILEGILHHKALQIPAGAEPDAHHWNVPRRVWSHLRALWGVMPISRPKWL